MMYADSTSIGEQFLKLEIGRGDVVLFDFDNTIVVENSLVEWSKINKLASVKAALKAFIRHGATDSKTIRKIMFSQTLKGVSESFIRNEMLRVSRNLRINPATKAFMDKCSESGADVHIVTASPRIFVSAIIDYLNLEVASVIGTELESKEGLLTGKIIGDEVYGDKKPGAVNKHISNRIKACFGNLPEDSALLKMGDISFSVGRKSGEINLFLNQCM